VDFKKYAKITMTIDTWGDKPKSQVDNSTVDEEIDLKIDEHLADPDAHLEIGESLQSHKASEIIDHLAESVLNDKLQPDARAFIAIVASDGSGDFTDIQDAINYATSKGGGLIYVKSGRYYPTSNLVLSRGVDLVGDGMNETIIDFEDQDFCISCDPAFSFGSFSSDSAQFTNGSKIVTFPAGTNLLSNGISAGFRLTNDTLEGEYLEIESVDSETQLTLVSPYSYATESVATGLMLWGTFTNGSKIVTFPAGTNLITNGVRNVYTIIDDFQEGYNYNIESVDSETQITLVEEYRETSGSGQCYIFSSSEPSHQISDIGVFRCGADFAFLRPTGGGLFNLERVSISYSKGVLQSLYTDEIGYVKNCYFYSNLASVFFDIKGYNIDSNIIHGGGTNLDVFKIQGQAMISNNRISVSGLNNEALFNILQNGLTFQNNDVGDFPIFDRNTISRREIRLLNNIFDIRPGYDLDFIHYNSFVSNNRIFTYSGGKFHLTSASRNNIVSCNILDVAITDEGTENVLADNMNSAS
jgi:hypothetical protein